LHQAENDETETLQRDGNSGVLKSLPTSKTLRSSYDVVLKILAFTIPLRRSRTPKLATMVAPVGISRRTEIIIPSKLPITPKAQPKRRRFLTPFTNNRAAVAGMMRKEKTRKTPAILTEEVTTNPKVI
jgi:hypothetical protein